VQSIAVGLMSKRQAVYEDDFEEFITDWMEGDNNEDGFLYGMYQYATHIDKYLTRSDYRKPTITGLEWVESILGNRKACYTMFRMSPTMFYSLHDLLTSKYELKSTPKCSSVEAVGMFLWMLGAPQFVRQAEDRFKRSLATGSHNFNKVLKSVVKVAGTPVRSTATRSTRTQKERKKRVLQGRRARVKLLSPRSRGP